HGHFVIGAADDRGLGLQYAIESIPKQVELIGGAGQGADLNELIVYLQAVLAVGSAVTRYPQRACRIVLGQGEITDAMVTASDQPVDQPKLPTFVIGQNTRRIFRVKAVDENDRSVAQICWQTDLAVVFRYIENAFHPMFAEGLEQGRYPIGLSAAIGDEQGAIGLRNDPLRALNQVD